MEREEKKSGQELFDEALAALRKGGAVSGRGHVLGPMIKELLEAALEGEMDSYLEQSKSEGKQTRRNGKSTKTVKGGSSGSFELQTPRDRSGDFDPMVVGKRQVMLPPDLEQKVISLYARGMSYSDISVQLEEIYGFGLSKAQLSTITDKVLPAMQDWRSRSLESCYYFVFLDCMFCKVRHEGRVVKRAVYNVMAIDGEGHKDILGIYLAEEEGARFWTGVLNDLKTRGVERILIASVDGLKGFPEAIERVFPKTDVQLCIVHLVRQSVSYTVEKDNRSVCRDLKKIYGAATLAQAEHAMDDFEAEWGGTYPMIVKLWRRNWSMVVPQFEYGPHVRKVMYTTNAIEGYHRMVRKVTKTKGAFSSETALLKLLYLATMNITEKWVVKTVRWGLIKNELHLHFQDLE